MSEAAAAVAATLETARKGVIYEHEAVAVPARRLAAAWRQALIALAPPAAQIARLEEDAAAALRCVERGARTAAEVLVGDEPPVFINVLGRLMPDPSAEGPDGGGDRPAAGPGAPLIIP